MLASISIFIISCTGEGGIAKNDIVSGETEFCFSDNSQEIFYLTICAIFRDEDRFLREWIEFHLCHGFEHIFLFADRPSNITCTSSLLRPYIESGHVTLDQGVPTTDPQIPTYNLCLQRHGPRARWIAFIDIDEFLFPSNSSESVPRNRTADQQTRGSPRLKQEDAGTGRAARLRGLRRARGPMDALRLLFPPVRPRRSRSSAGAYPSPAPPSGDCELATGRMGKSMRRNDHGSMPHRARRRAGRRRAA